MPAPPAALPHGVPLLLSLMVSPCCSPHGVPLLFPSWCPPAVPLMVSPCCSPSWCPPAALPHGVPLLLPSWCPPAALPHGVPLLLPSWCPPAAPLMVSPCCSPWCPEESHRTRALVHYYQNTRAWGAAASPALALHPLRPLHPLLTYKSVKKCLINKRKVVKSVKKR